MRVWMARAIGTPAGRRPDRSTSTGRAISTARLMSDGRPSQTLTDGRRSISSGACSYSSTTSWWTSSTGTAGRSLRCLMPCGKRPIVRQHRSTLRRQTPERVPMGYASTRGVEVEGSDCGAVDGVGGGTARAGRRETLRAWWH